MSIILYKTTFVGYNRHMSDIREIVEFWNNWFVNESNLSKRSLYDKKEINKSFGYAFIGVRRSGKTSIACMNAEHIKKGATCYINFEDPFFINNNDVSLLEQIPEIFKEIYKKKVELLILDEIQNIPNWERWVRKIIDTKSFQIFITGSSAKLLSSELSTSLTGRCLETKVWPLSFSEYLQFKGKHNIKNYNIELEHYMLEGGFPEPTLEKNKTQKIEILRSYLQDIIYKDIASRYEIRQLSSLQSMIQYLLTNISSKHSFTSIKKAFDINVATAQDYALYCQSAFLLFFVKKYDRNLKVQSRNPQKVYCIDTGLRQANAFYHSLDQGKLIENVVFLELLRRNETVFYHQEKYEVDFLILELGLAVKAINVCYCDLKDEETYIRETEGMLECLKMHGLKQGTILTKSLDVQETRDGREIIFKPVYKFLLEKTI